MARPGCFISAPDSSAASDSFQHLQLRCLPPTHNSTTAMRKAASFRRHDPLLPAAHGAFLSYESISMPGKHCNELSSSIWHFSVQGFHRHTQCMGSSMPHADGSNYPLLTPKLIQATTSRRLGHQKPHVDHIMARLRTILAPCGSLALSSDRGKVNLEGSQGMPLSLR